MTDGKESPMTDLEKFLAEANQTIEFRNDAIQFLKYAPAELKKAVMIIEALSAQCLVKDAYKDANEIAATSNEEIWGKDESK